MNATGPHDSRAVARRRLGYVTPDNVSKVLSHDRYWTPEFLHQLFRKADEARFDDPQAAFRLAQVLPGLAERIPWARFGDPQIQRPWTVRATALHMETADMVGQVDLARMLSARAAAIRPVPRFIAAELYRRQGAVHLRQGLLSPARLKIEQARNIYRSLDRGLDHDLAETIFLDAAAGGSPVGLAEIVVLVRMRRSNISPILLGALWGLVQRIYSPLVGPDAVEAALRWLLSALERHKDIYRRGPGGLPKALIVWNEGAALARLGIERLARIRLQRARLFLGRLQHDTAFTACTLDLVAVLRGLGSIDEARDLIQDTSRNVREHLRPTLQGAESVDWLRLEERRRHLDAELPDLGTFYPLTSKTSGDRHA